MKIGFVGSGNMAQALIAALVEAKVCEPRFIFVSNRSPGKPLKLRELYGVTPCATNEEAISSADVVVLAVKPQDLRVLLEGASSFFEPRHLILSLAAGFPLRELEKLIPSSHKIVRVMPNTPSQLRSGVTGYCMNSDAEVAGEEVVVRRILEPLGLVVRAEEGEAFEALTVSCSSGTGFVLELMKYWQDWIEDYGFTPEEARKMTVQTFLGTSMLAQKHVSTELDDLQARVASKKGVTAAGLTSMRELEIERVLRISFEKAVLRDQEIARSIS